MPCVSIKSLTLPDHSGVQTISVTAKRIICGFVLKDLARIGVCIMEHYETAPPASKAILLTVLCLSRKNPEIDLRLLSATWQGDILIALDLLVERIPER